MESPNALYNRGEKSWGAGNRIGNGGRDRREAVQDLVHFGDRLANFFKDEDNVNPDKKDIYR